MDATMLSKLREKYWITDASTSIWRVLSKCVICQKMNAQPLVLLPLEASFLMNFLLLSLEWIILVPLK